MLKESLVCDIVYPALSSGAYYFTTPSNLKYEVRFAKKIQNMFSVTMAFGVVNEEFEDNEYIATNKGEIYKVMQTVVAITNDYIAKYKDISSLEFFCEGADEKKKNQRLLLYKRFLNKISNGKWDISYLDKSGICLKRILN